MICSFSIKGNYLKITFMIIIKFSSQIMHTVNDKNFLSFFSVAERNEKKNLHTVDFLNFSFSVFFRHHPLQTNQLEHY